MGYENPLLKLPAGQALRRLPKDDRARIEAVMRELRDQANTEAENAWRRRKGPMAAYWRAVATYARHLAHAERDKVKAAYNHAEYMPERREMMQAWSDWIDGLSKISAPPDPQ